MFQTILNSLFGCSHQRTTFPLTPARKSSGHPAPGVARSATYVVCLDCGKEFSYDWSRMRVGQPVTARVPAPAPTLVSAPTRPTITA
jgi:hypothetical protein